MVNFRQIRRGSVIILARLNTSPQLDSLSFSNTIGATCVVKFRGYIAGYAGFSSALSFSEIKVRCHREGSYAGVDR